MSIAPIRVLVVDDSALMRKLIPQILEKDASIQVVGTAMDGTFGLRKIEDLKPDVITLDLDMPRMDGLETLRQITRSYHIPVIIVSAHSTSGATLTFKALSLGALDFVAKPRDAASAKMDEIANELISKIKIAARAERRKVLDSPEEFTQKAVKPLTRRKLPCTKLVVIGVSTGGPNALQFMLSQLPGDFSGGIVVVQHMPEGFTELFARRLDETCAVEVKEAKSGDMILAGRVLICPGNRHIKVRRMPLGDTVLLTDEERVNGHRPSADLLFRSAAHEFRSSTIGLIMTGMGEDGAAALGDIKTVGGLTIAQDEASSVVYGMPKAAVEMGTAMRVLPLDGIADALVTFVQHARPIPDPSCSVGD